MRIVATALATLPQSSALVRRVIYATNAIEALKPAAARGDQDEGNFPSEDAAPSNERPAASKP
jgi:transposase-like protein